MMRQCEKKNESTSLHNSTQDSLITWRTRSGNQAASIATLTASSASTIRELRSKDSSVQELQRILDSLKRKNVRMAAHISSVTHDTGTTPVYVMDYDTIKEKIWPVYHTTWNNRWTQGRILASHDSIERHITTFNEYDISTVQKRKNIFSKPYMETTILNKNPNTRTRAMRTFQIECSCNRWKWFGVGTAVGFGGAVLLFK